MSWKDTKMRCEARRDFKKVTIEGNKKSVIITVLEGVGNGYKGLSASISKEVLVNKLIQEGVLEDGESVHFDEHSDSITT
ncbi:hypothetical protein JUJ52_02915 [Virgibacillus sp. AGTR]|uniref:hypothetical protein n=1 Tax=Virgibacillus sp. AGTR TaxID=2812055 RepID=UPI001D165F75|nr:hypothetical protein [Virgibacillus sp. AGTR]MCC2248908.1 hypothetical protein [Virgibacillus sp. AGTR]